MSVHIRPTILKWRLPSCQPMGRTDSIKDNCLDEFDSLNHFEMSFVLESLSETSNITLLLRDEAKMFVCMIGRDRDRSFIYNVTKQEKTSSLIQGVPRLVHNIPEKGSEHQNK